MDRNSSSYDTILVDLTSGTLCLNRVLKREWQVGLNTLPCMVRATIVKYIAMVLKGIVVERKVWLVLICRTRESQGVQEHIIVF